MLDFMRRQRSTLKWVWVLLIFIFSVTLVTLYIPYGDLGTVSITNDVGSVGSQNISAREFQNAYRSYLDRMSGQINPQTLRAFRFERQIMDALVMRRVITEEARRLGLNVAASEIEQKILENPVFRENGNFIGQVRYQGLLAQNNLTVEDFESNVADDILSDKLRSFITAGVSVNDKEVEEEYKRRNEKVKFDYFVIDASKLGDKVTVTDQDERDYYEKNKARYNVGEKRQAKYVFVSSLMMRPKVETSDDELRQYYEQHKAEYDIPDRVTAQHILFKTQGKTPAEIDTIRKKAQDVLDRAKKAEDFAGLAKQFSEDTSAANGGNLGSFTRGQMVPEFERVAFSLGAGAISDLVQTQFGLHIIKVTAKEEARTRPFEELKEAVRPIVSTRKAEQKAGDAAQQIAVELVNSKDLNAVAAKYGAEVKDTPLMEQNQPIAELGNAVELTRRMFTMNKGEIGTAIQVERGYVVPMLTEIAAAHPASFDEGKARVAEDVKAEKAQQLAVEKGKQVQELIKSGKDLGATAKAAGAEIKTSELVTRGSTLPDFGPIVELEKDLFSLPVGKAGVPVSISGKTVAFAMKEHQQINPEEMKKSMEALRNEILPTKGEKYFADYMLGVRKKMQTNGNIRINESVLTQIVQSMG